MMRRLIPGVFIVLLIAMPTFGRSAARGQLQRLIPNAKFDNVSLADSMDFISSVSGANIVVDWKSLSDANITKQTQINLNLHDVTLQRLLTMVLREASNGGAPLTWYIEDNIVNITTQAAADSKNVTAVYYVLDIILDNSQFNGIISNPNVQFTNTGSGSSGGGGGSSAGGGGGGGGGLFGGGSSQQNTNRQTNDQAAAGLIKLIEGIVRPDIWEDNNKGGTASISYFNGNLIVSAPRSVQEAIGGPLE
jgi:uncharacterized membrane protein YgcG